MGGESPISSKLAVRYLRKLKSASMISNMYMKYSKLEGTWLVLCTEVLISP